MSGKKGQKIARPKKIRIELLSKKVEIYTIESPPYVKCSRCGGPASTVYHYFKTNIGDAYLCSRCNSFLTNLNTKMPTIVYSAFETNRKKH